jgi:hypothetical protein
VLKGESSISYSQAKDGWRIRPKNTATDKAGDRVARFVFLAKTYFSCKKVVGKYN